MTAHALLDAAVLQPIHGDFHTAQVLIDAARVGILDLDRASSGDPVSDLGNFAAHLEYAAIDGTLSPAVRDLAVDAFITGYEQTAGLSARKRIHAHIAAGLLRLGSRPFRTRASEWADRMSALLDRIDLQIAAHRRSPSRHTVTRCDQVPGPLDVVGDLKLGLAPEALDPTSVAHHFARLARWRSTRALTVSAIRVVRHKPCRRCLIEYDIEVADAAGVTDRVTVIGKVKAKGADRHTFELTRKLWQRLEVDANSRIRVPEPIGIVPEWKMWLQAKVPGTTAGCLLGGRYAPLLGRRAAEVVHEIQRANLLPMRSHTSGDELRILRERLSQVAVDRPSWKRRLETLADNCGALLDSLEEVGPGAVHRDFHPGQLIVHGDRVHVLDLDLYATGDPGLDVGNFLAHVTEWSLRELGDPDRLRACAGALMDRFLELTPAVDRRRLEVYRLVSLARHVHISTRFADRQASTTRILEYCEDQVGRSLTENVVSSPRAD
jgi:aminoglycoside phosphotransferase (APT) family kinase protein